MYLFTVSIYITLPMCYVIYNKGKYKVPKELRHVRDNKKYIKYPMVPSMSINMIPQNTVNTHTLEFDHGRGIVRSEIWDEMST